MKQIFRMLLSNLKRDSVIYVTGSEYYYAHFLRVEQKENRLDTGKKENKNVKKVSGYTVGNRLCYRHFPVEEECSSSSQNNG